MPGGVGGRGQRSARDTDQEPVAGRALQHPGERLDGLAVGPLEVVEAQEHRSAVGVAVEQLVEELRADER